MGFNFTALDSLYGRFIETIPSILSGLIFIFSCIIIYATTVFLFKKLLKITKLSQINSKINNNDFLKKSNININIDKIILQTLKTLLILLILVMGADFFGLTMVSQQISNLINYLPQLISAILIFVIGFFLGNKLKELLRNILQSFDLNGGNIISNIVFYVILVFVSITALNQAGINTDIITSNLSIIMGAFLLTFTIAFGLGSIEIVKRLLFVFYTNKNLAIGQYIEYEGKEGRIIDISNITLTLLTKEEKILIPIKKVNDSVIKIIDK